MTLPTTHTREVYRYFKEAFILEGKARNDYLAALGNESLLLEVRALLTHAGESGCDPAIALSRLMADVVRDEEEALPLQIGRYKVLGQLGQGGMGRVFLVEQPEPRRKVALKLIRRELRQQRFLARFEQEKLTLARLSHPYIVGIFEAGATDAGHPYLVMEYIQGQPVTDYCDRVEMSLTERLRLFLQICKGVQYAHQKAVIHCDLKPSNILITERDGQGLPNIIDFGIARLCGHQEDGIMTATRDGVQGTPAYMSPEQFGDRGDVDIRADIYGLGVILFELLVGAVPTDASPYTPLPSTKSPPSASHLFSTMDKVAAARVSRLRGLSVKALRRTLHEDLDWLLHKALASDRDQRYTSVSALATDVGRFLDGIPLAAAPNRLYYRWKKNLIRHRRGFSMVALIVVLLIGGIVGSISGWQRASSEAESARDSLALIQEMLAGANPNQSGKDPRVSELLAEFDDRIDEQFGKKPQTAGLLHETFARTYLGIGKYKKAYDHGRKAIIAHRLVQGESGQATLQSQAITLEASLSLGLFKEGREQAESAFQQAKKTMGDDHLITLELASLNALMEERLGNWTMAEPLHRFALEGNRKVFGEVHEQTLACLNNLSSMLYRNGRYSEAMPLQQACVRGCLSLFGETHPYTFNAKSGLGGLHSHLGAYSSAEDLFREVHAGRRKQLGDSHPATIKALSDLASNLSSQECHQEAVALNRQVLQMRVAHLGADHPQTLNTAAILALSLGKTGEHGEAEELLRKTFTKCVQTLGVDHPKSFDIQVKLARVLGYENHFEEAEALFREALAREQKNDRGEHRRSIGGLFNLSVMLDRQGRREEALTLMKEVLSRRQRTLGDEHPVTKRTRIRLNEWLKSSATRSVEPF